MSRANEPGGLYGGLSSSNNDGVGSLLQQIEQSEKSNAGETEQNDYFIDYINSNPKVAAPQSSLFINNQSTTAAMGTLGGIGSPQ